MGKMWKLLKKFFWYFLVFGVICIIIYSMLPEEYKAQFQSWIDQCKAKMSGGASGTSVGS